MIVCSCLEASSWMGDLYAFVDLVKKGEEKKMKGWLFKGLA